MNVRMPHADCMQRVTLVLIDISAGAVSKTATNHVCRHSNIASEPTGNGSNWRGKNVLTMPKDGVCWGFYCSISLVGSRPPFVLLICLLFVLPA